MIGQGRPRDPTASAVRQGLVAFAVLIGTTSNLGADSRSPVVVRLQVTWHDLNGNGRANAAVQPIRGSLELSDGRWEYVDQLGADPDGVGCVWIDAHRLHVDTLDKPLAANTFEVDAIATDEATITIRLESVGQSAPTLTIPIHRFLTQRNFDWFGSTDLLGARAEHLDETLDTLGIRLEIRAAPHEQIRVHPQRTALIFTPGETWSPRIECHIPRLTPGQSVRLHAGFRDTDGKEVENHGVRHTLQADANGQLAPLSELNFTLPQDEGSHTFFVEFQRQGLSVRKTLLRRQFDVLVLNPKATSSSVSIVEPTAKQVDLRDGSQRFMKLPRMPLPSKVKDSTSPRIVDRNGQCWVMLSRNVWQAHTITVDALESPHAIEVEYNAATPQTLGVAVVEADPDGSEPRVLADTAIRVPSPDESISVSDTSRSATHRLIFWPHRRNVWLLFSNRDSQREASYSTVRLLTFPDRLPLPVPPAPDERLAAMWIENPRFVDLFTGYGQDSWQEYHRAAERMLDVTLYNGYNSLVLPLSASGGCLYPSSVWPNLPHFDRHTNSSDRQPIRKDIAELVFRLADRAGIRVIPALTFDTKLPVLESQRRLEPHNVALLQVAEDSENSSQPQQTPYNPLHPLVQQAMETTVREIVERYGKHASFGGVLLQSQPEGYGQLRNPEAAMSEFVFAQYTRDIQHGASSPDGREVSQVLYGPERTQWLDWSCQQIAQLHERMAQAIVDVRPEARLFVSLDELVDRSAASDEDALTGQALSQIQSLREKGLDIMQISQQPHVVVLQPRHENAWSVVPATVPQRDRRRSEVTIPDESVLEYGSISQLSTVTLEIPALPARASLSVPASPFDRGAWLSDARPILLTSPIDLSGPVFRRGLSHSVAQADPSVIVDRYPHIPQVPTLTLRPWLEGYRILPHLGRRITSGPDYPSESAPPVPVRLQTGAKQARLFAINDAPTEVQLSVKLRTPPDARFRSHTPAAPSQFKKDRELPGVVVWTSTIPPYDLTIADVNSDQIVVVAVTSEIPQADQARQRLQQRLQDLETRPLTQKIDFDSQNGDVWTSQPEGHSLLAVADPESPSNRVLQLQSTGQTVIARSAVLEVPPTGCISLQARVYVAFPQSAPELRVRVNPHGSHKSIPLSDIVTRSPTGWHDLPELVWPTPKSATSRSIQLTVELHGEGTVWLDDIKLSGFTAADRGSLQKSMIAASNHLRNGRYIECAKILDGYWPRFLMTEIPSLADVVPAQASKENNDALRKAESPSWFSLPRFLR